MDYGVFLPVSGAACTRDGLLSAAAAAEELGFSTVWAADRIVIPWNIESDYAYSWSGKFIVPPDKPFLEPLTALAFLAGATERVKLGVSVLVAPYRDPVYWAKVAATLDWLSGGRFILGLGIGWMKEEFAALGRSGLFAERAQVAEEQIRVAQTLFAEDVCNFDGDYYSFEDIAFYPKAFDRDFPIPFWCGGEGAGARRRAGIYGDAWFPYFARVTPAELRRRFEEVQAHAGAAGRGGDQVRLNCCLAIEITDTAVDQEPDLLRGSPDQIAARLAEFEGVGVEHCALQFLVGRYPERLAQMRRFSQELITGSRS